MSVRFRKWSVAVLTGLTLGAAGLLGAPAGAAPVPTETATARDEVVVQDNWRTVCSGDATIRVQPISGSAIVATVEYLQSVHVDFYEDISWAHVTYPRPGYILRYTLCPE